MRSRTFITLFTSALLLSASLFLAPAAFAVGDVCPEGPGDAGWSSHLHQGDPDVTAPGGTITIDWDGGSVTWTVNDGYSLDLCIKSGEDAGFENPDPGTTPPGSRSTLLGLTEDDSVEISKEVSHISYRFNELPDVTADATIGNVACGETSVGLTLESDGTSDFTVTVGSLVQDFDGVSGTSNETLDLSSLADGNYTVTVSSADLAADVEKDITIQRDCSSEVTATASVGDVECGETSVGLTLGSDGTSDFTVTVGSLVQDFDGVSGTSNETLDLSSLADGNYTVTVSSADLAADVEKDITIQRECGSRVTADADVAGDCETLSATVELTGNEGDQFTVTINDEVVEIITLGPDGAANRDYDLPENAESRIEVAGAASDVATVDCTVEVEDVVNEKPEKPDKGDPAPDVEDDDEVEVLPEVIDREELSATGDDEDRMLVIALALVGLGLPLTLVKPRRQQLTA